MWNSTLSVKSFCPNKQKNGIADITINYAVIFQDKISLSCPAERAGFFISFYSPIVARMKSVSSANPMSDITMMPPSPGFGTWTGAMNATPKMKSPMP